METTEAKGTWQGVQVGAITSTPAATTERKGDRDPLGQWTRLGKFCLNQQTYHAKLGSPQTCHAAALCRMPPEPEAASLWSHNTLGQLISTAEWQWPLAYPLLINLSTEPCGSQVSAAGWGDCDWAQQVCLDNTTVQIYLIHIGPNLPKELIKEPAVLR